jgi:cytochrome c-type biogenesis protein CcmH
VVKLLRILAAALGLMLLSSSTFADAPDPVLEARVNKIAVRLRCLVCQNQSIAESQADLANDLRRQVREMLVAGKSEKDILDFMVERYGDFVLYDPPFQMTTLLLWGGPAALMLIGLSGFAWTVRARRRQASAPMLSDADKAHARALLDDAGDNNNDNKNEKPA